MDSIFEREINGLTNLGNTCYINSVLQSICLNQDFCYFLLSDKYKKKISKHCQNRFFSNLIKTLRAMHEVKKIIAPISLIDSLGNEIDDFEIHSQQDAMEILSVMLDKVDTLLSREVNVKIKQLDNCDELTIKSKNEWSTYLQKNYSEVKKYYYGQLCSVTKCECNYESIIFEPAMNLSLSLPIKTDIDTIHLNDCLNNMITEEIMEGDNKYHCSKCEKRCNARKKVFLKIIPSHLIIQLKRFTYTEDYQSRKLNNFVDFPFELDISSIVYDGEKRDCRYSLYSVINHVGNFGDGHYFTFSRIGNKWYCFNDENVSEVDEPTISNKYAYILFYKKISS
jgi:ubiquitin carboxyl-terminal hydrolase 8